MIYDATLKDLLNDLPNGLLRLLLGDAVTARRTLPTEVQVVGYGRMDLLLELVDGRIVHLELQLQPDPTFDLRMLRYWERVYRNGRIAPQQIALWGGRGGVGVAGGIQAGRMNFSFDVVDLRQRDLSALVESGTPGEAIIALLGKVDKPRVMIRAILNRMRSMTPGERQDYVQKLLIISGLRGLKEVVQEEQETMALVDIDPRDIPFVGKIYEEALLKGEEKGMEKGLHLSRQTLIDILTGKFGSIDEPTLARIRTGDTAAVNRWILGAVRAQSLDQVFL